MKNCTFKPEIMTRAKSTKDMGKKLYLDAFARMNKMKSKKTEVENEAKNKENKFMPVTSVYKPEIFEENPLQNDTLVKKVIERQERARIEKKIAEIQSSKGMTTIKSLKNLDLFLKEEVILPAFRFDVSIRCNKHSIENRVKPLETNTNDESEIREKTSFSISRTPLLILDINIDDKNKEKLEIFMKDNIEQLVQNFCDKHKLDEEKKKFLKCLINDKMRDFAHK